MGTQHVFIDFEKNYKYVEPTPFHEIGDLWILDQRCRVMERVINELSKDGMFIIRTEITLECVKQNEKYILDQYSHTIYEFNCEFCFHAPVYKLWPNRWLKDKITNELTKLQWNHKNTCRRRFKNRLLSLPFGNYLAPYLHVHVQDIIKLFPKKIIMN